MIHNTGDIASLLSTFLAIMSACALFTAGMWCRARADAREWEAAFWLAYRHAPAKRERPQADAAKCFWEPWGWHSLQPPAAPPERIIVDEPILQ